MEKISSLGDGETTRAEQLETQMKQLRQELTAENRAKELLLVELSGMY